MGTSEEDKAQPVVYMLSGPNGAGKSTLARPLLCDVLNVPEFLNADLIAAGLSPFHPESYAFEAAETYRRVEGLKSFLKTFEQQIPTFNKPYDDRAKVWLEVVEAELERQNPYHVVLSKCLSQDSWRGWPPDWWPEAAAPVATSRPVEDASGTGRPLA